MIEIGTVNAVKDQAKSIFTLASEWFPYEIWEAHHDDYSDSDSRICQELQRRFIWDYGKNHRESEGIEDFQCAFIKVPQDRAEPLEKAVYKQIVATNRKGSENLDSRAARSLQHYAENKLKSYELEDSDGVRIPGYKFYNFDAGDCVYKLLVCHSHIRSIVAADILQQENRDVQSRRF